MFFFIKEAAKQGLANKLGSITLETLCTVFNSIRLIYITYKWKIHKEVSMFTRCWGSPQQARTHKNHVPVVKALCSYRIDFSMLMCENNYHAVELSKGKIPFLDNKSLLQFLCTFCSRDIVIRISSNKRKDATVRLRNHPRYLLAEQIEKERILAEKAVNFYFKYWNDNPENIEWKAGSLEMNFNLNETSASPYRSIFLDNVYASIHYGEDINSFGALSSYIMKHTNTLPICGKRYELTPNSELNLLLEMISAKGLAPLQYWDKEKIEIYMKIVHDLTASLNQFDQNFVFNYIELTLHKSGILMYYSLWSFRKMAKQILIVAQGSKFLSGEEIAEAINNRFKYNIYEWLKMHGLETLDDLFERGELSDRLGAICVKTKDQINYYRNMESIMKDSNLYPGFPFTAKKRLLNCLQEAKNRKLGVDGFVNEQVLKEIYYFCYKRNLDATEKVKLFGSNYDTVYEFWKEFDFEEVSISLNDDGTILYGLKIEFEEAYQIIIKQKKRCYESVKTWNKAAGPQSAYTFWKKGRLDYYSEVLISTKMFLARRL
uniref:Uncharacterized protein n=1 Tax=Panagrolaimus sp. ES5 TaxID=591445 RepID=A0AC34EZ22_9BILA